jgi:hypothetical protein
MLKSELELRPLRGATPTLLSTNPFDKLRASSICVPIGTAFFEKLRQDFDGLNEITEWLIF